LLVIVFSLFDLDDDDSVVLFVKANTFSFILLSKDTQHLYYRQHLQHTSFNQPQQRNDRLPHNNNYTLPTTASSTQASVHYENYDIDEQSNKEELVRHLQSHPPRQYEQYHGSEHF
jgi:hypothetical protein